MESIVPMYDTQVRVMSLGPGVGGLGLMSCRNGWIERTQLKACIYVVIWREANDDVWSCLYILRKLLLTSRMAK